MCIPGDDDMFMNSDLSDGGQGEKEPLEEIDDPHSNPQPENHLILLPGHLRQPHHRCRHTKLHVLLCRE